MGKSRKSSWQQPGKGSRGDEGASVGARRKGRTAAVPDDYAASDSPDEEDVEALMRRQRGKLSLDKADDSEDSEGMDEEEIMGLDDGDDNDDEEDDEEDEDEDDDDAMLERAIEEGGRAGELAKQAKTIGARLKLQRKEDFDEDEEVGEEDEGWGANKRQYYDADTAGLEGSDAEEALQEEEEEAMRLERDRTLKMNANDYGLNEDEEEEEESEETMGSKLRSAGKKKGRVEVEAVEKRLNESLTAEQREAALMSDAPELLALLQDLKDSLHEVRHKIGPVLHEVRSGGLGTAEGVSYLEAKHLLLLQYCTHVVFYVLLKAEGRPVKDHPVITRLVELRAYLEKIRPIDKRMQHQIDRLVKAVQVASKQDQALAGGKEGEEEAQEDDEDAVTYGPRRDLLASASSAKTSKLNEGSKDLPSAGNGIYRPPKIAPVSMEADETAKAFTRDESRLLKESRRKASRSAVIRELAEEIRGAPKELRNELPGFDSLAAMKQRQRMEARAAVEEDMMTRVPLSKEEAKKLKQQKRAGLSGTAALQDDFADEVADIVNMGKGSKLSELFGRQKVSQKFGAEPPRAIARGGDEDVPRKETLQDRRLKFESQAARRAKNRDEGDEDELMDTEFFGGGGEGKRQKGLGLGSKLDEGERVEDDVYLEAKAAAADRKRSRDERFPSRQASTLPPLAEEAAAGVRGITSEIERNRGLTPHRRKDLKNPRKKHRVKFAEAQVRRRGAVQDVRKQSAGGYGGEATGVKSRVVKSRKLG